MRLSFFHARRRACASLSLPHSSFFSFYGDFIIIILIFEWVCEFTLKKVLFFFPIFAGCRHTSRIKCLCVVCNGAVMKMTTAYITWCFAMSTQIDSCYSYIINGSTWNETSVRLTHLLINMCALFSFFSLFFRYFGIIVIFSYVLLHKTSH